LRYSLISRSAGVTRHRILRSPDFPRKNALRRSLRDRPFGSSFFLFQQRDAKDAPLGVSASSFDYNLERVLFNVARSIFSIFSPPSRSF